MIKMMLMMLTRRELLEMRRIRVSSQRRSRKFGIGPKLSPKLCVNSGLDAFLHLFCSVLAWNRGYHHLEMRRMKIIIIIYKSKWWWNLSNIWYVLSYKILGWFFFVIIWCPLPFPNDRKDFPLSDIKIGSEMVLCWFINLNCELESWKR